MLYKIVQSAHSADSWHETHFFQNMSDNLLEISCPQQKVCFMCAQQPFLMWSLDGFLERLPKWIVLLQLKSTLFHPTNPHQFIGRDGGWWSSPTWWRCSPWRSICTGSRRGMLLWTVSTIGRSSNFSRSCALKAFWLRSFLFRISSRGIPQFRSACGKQVCRSFATR